MTKTENNARIGRLYFQSINDAAGYPNGLPYWPEMAASEKYQITLEGLTFLDYCVQSGHVLPNPTEPFGVTGAFGEGECKELMDHFEKTSPDELKEFQERLTKLNARNTGSNPVPATNQRNTP